MNKINEATEPYQKPSVEIGLMTQDEFLEFRNPEGKGHSPESYKGNIDSMNRDFSVRELGRILSFSTGTEIDKRYNLYANKNGYLVYEKDNDFNSASDLVGVINDGIYYHTHNINRKNPTLQYQSNRDNEMKKIPIDDYKLVKYISDYVHLVSNPASENQKEYPYLVNRTKISNEYFEIRMEDKPTKENQGLTIVILNEEKLVVAKAQDEWGATLITVAEEYRGYGLGKVIGKLWYQYNPHKKSGGFTPSGKFSAIKIWQDRVYEMLQKGWYSELIKQGEVTKGRVREIIKSAGDKIKDPKKDVPIKDEKPIIEPLILTIDDSVFVIYDKKFYEEPEEEYIYVHGFFRDFDDDVFIYSIDYDKKFKDQAYYVALQLARNNDQKINIKKSPSDVLEMDNLKYVEEDEGYVYLTQDVIDIKKHTRFEKNYRKKNDPYSEYYNMILELANSKWK